MSKQEKIIQKLRQEANNLDIPQGISPEQMRCKLELMEEWKETEQSGGKSVGREKQKIHRFPMKQMSAVACMLLLILGATAVNRYGRLQSGIVQNPDITQKPTEQTAIVPVQDVPPVSANEEIQTEEHSYPDITYEEIYAAMLPAWEQEGWFLTKDVVENGMVAVPEMDVAESMSPSERGNGFKEMTAVKESVIAESTVSQENSDSMNVAADLAVGTTNVQTPGVDEGDIVKNDGRYLYQSILLPAGEGGGCAIQIVDTKEGLQEIARVEGFDSIREFYVTDNLLIVIENKYRRQPASTPRYAEKQYAGCVKLGYENYYHEITIFDLSNHTKPEKIKTFTLEGTYESSRVADGYFYGFSRYYATPGEGEADYDAYIPRINGTPLEADRILLPEKRTGTSYLVLISVDLKEPDRIFESTAVLSKGNLYYVSRKNIYVTYLQSVGGEEGWVSDSTAILRFSYKAGHFALEAEGEVKGTLDNSFSLDEYNGYLRAVSTVREYRLKKLVDDRTGKTMGSSVEEDRQTNALYVLSPELETVGTIEGLAEEEQIYSARFLGNMGYFVTFRQTDPLFAVDLTIPEEPKILSELKIIGFSEYLHFYGKDRLLGIGMEADENTGAQKGLKLSMFDISDPENVTEIQKLWLEEYNYSEALYNHRAVLISTQANLFGFEAEGSGKGKYWKDYLLFSYEDENFVTRLSLDTKTDEGYYQSRGTFIGDVFYLLSQDGSVQSYNWKTGEQLERLTFTD